MNADLRALAAMLHTISQEAGSIARRLAPEQDWQYPAAVALRVYTDDCARHLPKYLRRETSLDLGWRLRYEAALCTGKLAPLRPPYSPHPLTPWLEKRLPPATFR
jgi:hypothetical protein